MCSVTVPKVRGAVGAFSNPCLISFGMRCVLRRHIIQGRRTEGIIKTREGGAAFTLPLAVILIFTLQNVTWYIRIYKTSILRLVWSGCNTDECY